MDSDRRQGLAAPGAPAAAVTGTRERVLALLHERGPLTSADLAEALALSTAGVRRHLDALTEEGLLTHRERRAVGTRGRGRPARLWALTPAGHDKGPSAYDDLAADALRFLAEQGGPDAVRAFAERRVAELEDRYRDALDGVAPDQRAAALAAAMTADGYAASAAGTPEASTGVQLCQHHCPVQQVAEQFPEFCDAETAAISRLLDVHVQRLATIAHGDGVCTTHIPLHVTPSVPSGRDTHDSSCTTNQKAVS